MDGKNMMGANKKVNAQKGSASRPAEEFEVLNSRAYYEDASKEASKRLLDLKKSQQDILLNPAHRPEDFINASEKELSIHNKSASSQKGEAFRRIVFAEKSKAANAQPVNYDFEFAASEIAGKNAVDKKGIRLREELIKKAQKENAEKLLAAKSLKETREKYTEQEIDFKKINGYSDDRLKELNKEFKKFAFADLSAYKSDKDFVKNYAQIMQDIDQQIEKGYAIRRYYYENDVTSSEEKDCLNAIAKTAALYQIKRYMTLRAELIESPYYALIDSKTLFSLDEKTIEQKFEAAQTAGNSSLVVFLGILAQIKLLGFNVDGTGRREKMAELLKNNKDAWKEERDKVSDYVKLEKEVHSISAEISSYNSEIKIIDGKKLEADKAKKEKDDAKKLADLNKAETAQRVKENIARNREEWIKKIEEYAKGAGWTLNLDVYKENLLLHIGQNMFADEHLTDKEENKFLRAIMLFNNRIKEKEQQIDDAMENNVRLQVITCELPSKKQRIKEEIIKRMIEKDVLLASEEEFDLDTIVDSDFVLEYKDDKMSAHYEYIALEFPKLIQDKTVWNNIVTEKLLGLEDEAFKVEIAELKAQADFYNKVIKSIIAEAFEDKKLHYNVRRKVFDAVLENLGARAYIAPISEVVIETKRIVNNRDLLHIVNRTDFETGYNGTFNLNEEQEWDALRYSDPVMAVKDDLYKKMPMLREIFGESEYELTEYVLDAMRSCPAVTEKYPDAANFENADEIAKLNYTDFNKIMTILSDNVVKSIDKFAERRVSLSKEVQKYAVSKMMAGDFSEEKIQEAIESGKAKEEAKKADNILAKKAFLGRFNSKEATMAEPKYNYGRVQGVHLFAQQILGINIREAEFKVPKRFEKIKKAQAVWKAIDDADRTAEVLEAIHRKEKLSVIFGNENSDIFNELLLCGCSGELFSVGGPGEKFIYAYEDSDYQRCSEYFSYVIPRMLKVEAALKERSDKAEEFISIDQLKDSRNALRSLAAGLKPIDGLNRTQEAEARKYNYDHYGVETFEEALELYRNSNDDEAYDARMDFDLRIESLRKYKDGLLAPILPNLIKRHEFAKKLVKEKWSNTDEENLLGQELEAKFAPFLRALAIASGKIKADKKKGEKVEKQLEFLLSQYINNNFDLIYESCSKEAGTVNEWGKAISEYSDLLTKTEIEGRGSISQIIEKGFEYAASIDKFRGGELFMAVLEEYPQAFDILLEDAKAFNEFYMNKYTCFMANEAILKKFLKDKKASEKTLGATVGRFEKQLYKGMFKAYEGDLENNEFYKQVEGIYLSDESLVETEEKRKEKEKLEASAGQRGAMRKIKEDTDKKIDEGLKEDKDFQTLLGMEKAILKNPYVYLSVKNITKVRSGEDDGKTKQFTPAEAEKYLAKVDAALKKMQHENELPDTLKAFMAEVCFADSSLDIYQALRYMIGAYRTISDHYKYGGGAGKYKDVQAAIERAVIYTYINETDFTIPDGTGFIYKYKRAPKLKGSKVKFEKLTVAKDAYAGLSDDEKIEKYYEEAYKGNVAEAYKLEKLTAAQKKSLLKLIDKKRKAKVSEANAKNKKAYKDAEKKEKAAEAKDKFEKKHKEYLIPVFKETKFRGFTDAFEKVFSLNAALQKKLEDGSLSDSSLLAEYRFFLKNIQMSMYGMKPEAFEEFVNRRLAYFDYAQKVRNVLKAQLSEKKKYYDDAYQGYCEYYRADIVKNLEGGIAFDEESWKQQILADISNEGIYKAVSAGNYSYDDSLGRVRFYKNQNKLSDISGMIRDSKKKSLIAEFASLSAEEKLLFAAALSLASKSAENKVTSADIIAKDGGAGYSIENIKEAFGNYINTGKIELNIDYTAALYNLKDHQNSEQGVMAKLFNMEKVPVINETAFNAAMAMVRSVREVKAEKDGLDTATLGDSGISYAYAKNHHLRQAYEIDSRKNKDMSAFMANILAISKEDLNSKGQNSNYDSLLDKGHSLFERVDKAALCARLSSMTDDERMLFVAVIQDRTVLDYKSEDREEKFKNGEIIEHVNEQKRLLIKSQYIADLAHRSVLLEKAASKASLDNAFKTLLSFQLRDGVDVDGTMRAHFEPRSINRTALMDWELIKRAFDFIDELKFESARVSVVKKSSDLIDYSGNEKAIKVYDSVIKNESIELESEDDFLAFFKSEAVKGELLDEKHKAMLNGYKLLNEQQKMLFMRALQNRDIVDISKKNSAKNLVLGAEREYVNAPGRYALIDEYIKRSRSSKALIDDKNGLYKSAVKSLLSTQINDDLDFLKAAKKDIRSLFTSEGLFSSSRRNTAIDWDLFSNALQFVTRAENEKKITYEDAEIYRTMGNLSANGDFEFDPAFMRRNIHTTGGRFANYASGRVRKLVKKYIPETGNLRTLLSYVLNVDTMNAVNKSGFLAKAGTTGEINEKYAAVYKAEKLAEENLKTQTEIKTAQKEYAGFEAAQETAQSEFDSAKAALEEAKLKEKSAEEIAALEKKAEEAKKALKEADKNIVAPAKNLEMLKRRDNAQQNRIKALKSQAGIEQIKYDDYEKDLKKLQNKEFKEIDADTALTAEEKEAKKKNLTKALQEKYYQERNTQADSSFAGILVSDMVNTAANDRLEESEGEVPKEFEKELIKVGENDYVRAVISIPTKLLPNADISKLLKNIQEYTGIKAGRDDGQSVSADIRKYKNSALSTISLVITTKTDAGQQAYENLKSELIKQNKQAEKEAPDNGFKMTEAEVLEVLKKNAGLGEYAEMSGVITAITRSVGTDGINENAAKHIEAITNANTELLKLVALINSDESIADKLLNSSLDSMMGLAVIVGEDAGQAETMAKVKTVYDSVSKIKGDIQKSFDVIVSDKDVLSKLTEVQIGSILEVIGKYGKLESMDLIRNTANGIQDIASKLGRTIINYKRDTLIKGDKREFFDLNGDMMEQLGVDAMFELVSEYTTHFDQTGRATKITKSTKNLVKSAGTAIFTHLRNTNAMQEAKQRLEKAKAEHDKYIKSEEYLAMTTAEKKKYEESYKESISADEKITVFGESDNVADIIAALDLKSAGQIISAFMSEDNAIAVEKRSKQLNLVKEQITELFKEFNTSDDTKNIAASINLNKILEAVSLEKNGSKVKIVGEFAANSAKLLSNGFSIYLKQTASTNKNLVIGGVEIRKAGEDQTHTINKYGEKEDRLPSDVLNQYGVDEIFEIVKVVGILDPTGNAPKYVTATQNIKNETVKLLDKINGAMKKGGFTNWKDATDLDGCIGALSDMLKLNDSTEKYAAVTDALKEVNKLKNEAASLYEAMASDGNFFEKLNDLQITGLLDLTKKFDKDGFAATMGNVLSEAKKIYSATYGLYYQGMGFYKSLEYMFAAGKFNMPEENALKLYTNFKDSKLIGDKISKYYESGDLLNAVKAGMAIKESVTSFVNVFNYSRGLHTLRKNAYGFELDMKDMQDEVKLQKAIEEQNELISGDKFKLSESEKQLVQSAKARNLFMTKEGVTYARNDEIAGIVAEAVNIVGSVSKVTFDPTGIAKNLLIETAEFIKFFTKILTDNKALDDYFKDGPGAETIQKLMKLHMDAKEVFEEEQLIKEAKLALGLSDTMELRTFVGRNIVTSILFSASRFNMLEGTRSRAEAVLKAIGLSEYIGQTDEAAAKAVFDKLLVL